jgi:PTH1 family peptidyl-tRNA hydrolase
MKLIIGLGNIGKEYAKTRHNAGFLCLERFAVKHDLIFKKTRLYTYTKYLDSLLIKPTTYMNLSGEAYKSALTKFGRFDEVIVIMDDLELATGNIRIRSFGGDGGHNGLKSIVQAIGSDQVARIRIGIGRPKTGIARDYVLDTITSTEQKVFTVVFDLLSEWLDIYIRTDMKHLLDEFSKWKKRPVPSSEDGINSPKEELHDKGL